MGCDIHMYVESKTPGGENWWGFGGRVNPGRNYDLFSTLAGVRGGPAMFEQRGLPDNLGYPANGDAYLTVDDEHAADSDGYCNTAQAKSWGNPIVEVNGRKATLGPDWHSASWLTPSEFVAAIVATEKGGGYVDDEYHALAGAMQVLEVRGKEVRIVFWFDN